MDKKQELINDLRVLSSMTLWIFIKELKWAIFWFICAWVCVFEAFWFQSYGWAIPITIFSACSIFDLWNTRVFIFLFFTTRRIAKRLKNK